MARRPYPSDITDEVKDALDKFSDEELDQLRGVYQQSGSPDNLGFFGMEFKGIYLAFGDGYRLPAEKEKRDALDILVRQTAIELNKMGIYPEL